MSKQTRSPDPQNKLEVILMGTTIDKSNIFYDGIVQDLSAEKWDVHVVASSGPIGDKLFGQNATIHTLQMVRRFSPIHDLASLIQWVRLLSKIRPHILVIGTPKASLLGGIAARIMRIPQIIYVVHGLRSEGVQGVGGRILVAAEHITLLSAHRILAVSHSLKNAVEQVHPKFANRIEVLGYGSMNGVSLDRFKPFDVIERKEFRKLLGIPEKSFVVGFVGRFHRDKGGDLLLQLMQSSASRKMNLHLLVIGEVEDEELRPQIEELSSRNLITVTGWVDNPESMLAPVDLLLHPTRREGLGMSLLEAQASGIPVLTNRVTGTIDAVQSGVGGEFTDNDSLDSWIEKIETLVHSPELRRKMGEEGRAFVMERYDRESVSERFCKYIDDLRGSS